MTTEFDREFEELGRAEDAYLYGDAESETPADSTETAKHLAPGTYELTKRIEVDDDGTCHWVDMPDGPGVEYIAGFWHKTRSTVRRVPSGGTDNTPPGITEEMVEAAFDVWAASPADTGHQLVREILAAALAGRTVIDLPEPDVMCAEDWPRWFAHGVEVHSKRMVFAGRDNRQYLSSADARGYAAQLLAAADFADRLDRLAAESSKGGESHEC